MKPDILVKSGCAIQDLLGSAFRFGVVDDQVDDFVTG
jgi:hypothetical protein